MQTLHVYISHSGQYAGKLVEDDQELFGVAGCSTVDEVEEAACEAGYDAYALVLDDFLAGVKWWNGLTEDQRRYWLNFAESAVPADAYRAYLSSITTEL